MTPAVDKDLSRIGAIDYVLMTIGSCLAAFSGGMGVGLPEVGWFVITGILIGSIVSYAIRVTLLKSPIIKLDGWLYACTVIVAFAFGANLQGFMPEGGFPRELLAAGWLSWMLIFGSFFTWQDSTLLFQAIPSIALFGLVGCYDTFRGVTYAFFGFMLCLATLFGRAHRRSMLKQAADSGYFTRGLAPGTPTPSVETTPGLARKMESGPWRWIAGPEWALASGLAVVLISILGAPVIKQSVNAAGLSGIVKVSVPRSVRQRMSQPRAAMTEDFRGTVPIAQGPNNTLTRDPVLEVQMDAPRYLRMNAYEVFRGRGWASLARSTGGGLGEDVNADSLDGIAKYREIDFEIRLRTRMSTLPVPGIVTGWKDTPQVMIQPDGRAMITSNELGLTFRGRAAVVDPDGMEKPTEAVRDLPPSLSAALQSPPLSFRTMALVEEVTRDAKTDYEKADRIRDAIASRIVYNLNAAAPPAGADVVDHTLFDAKEGYCDVYATAMTTMARAAGIPARYVVGYLPGVENRDRSGRYVVLDSDLHAWSELYFKDHGWVVFDATEGAQEVDGAGRGDSTFQKPFFEREWVQVALDVTMGGLFLAGVALFVRSQLRRQRTRTPRTDLEQEYLVFARLLEKSARVRREPSRTPDEFLAEVKPKLGSAATTAEDVNRRFVRLLYAPGETSDADVAQLRTDLRNLSKMLRNTTPPAEAASPK